MKESSLLFSLANGVGSCKGNQFCQLPLRDWSLRLPSSKKLFPVCRVGKKTASREVGIIIFFPSNFFFFNKLECSGGGGSKKKKSSSRPFLAHLGGGQETTFYLRVALPLNTELRPCPKPLTRHLISARKNSMNI